MTNGKARWYGLLLGILLLFPATTVYAQDTGQISGTVTDAETGEPLPGVNVVVVGTQQGAATDVEGSYSISGLDAGTYDVRASFIGYQEQVITDVEVISGETTVVDFALQPGAIGLDEVVVVGYGTQVRADLTGAVSIVDSDQLEQVPVSSIAEALEGKVAGVRIWGGWSPSAESTIRIRGTRSITAGNDPLIVLNGVPTSIPLQQINPSSIASISVLKGTSATAIYGSRGANGVILITTKQGVPGELEVAYSGYVGALRRYGRLDMMNSEEFVAYRKEAYEAAGRTNVSLDDMFGPRELAGIKAGRSFPWVDVLARTGIQQEHNLRISGGTRQTQFMVLPSVYLSKGPVMGQYYNRYSLTSNISSQFSDRFQARLTILATRGLSSNGVGGLATGIAPLVGPYDEDGDLVLFPNNDNTLSNPLSDLYNTTTQTITNSVTSVLSAQYEFTPFLSYQVQFGPEFRFSSSGEYVGSQTGANQGADPTAEQSQDRLFHYTWNNIVRFDQRFADTHDIELTFAYTMEAQNETGFSTEVRGLPYNSLYYNLGSAREILGSDSYLSEWALQSFVGRINYIFNGKYLLTLTGRQDGSSRLATDNKWSFFPSIALAWRVSSEPFMDPVSDVLSRLKLSVGYGQSGNTAIDPYQTTGGLGRVPYAFGSAPAFGYYPEDISNPDLGWETTTQLNVGVDLGLWQGRVSGSVNFYRQYTSNLLLTRRLPTSTGFSNVLTNVGETRNVGLEVTVSTINIETESFQWTTNLNFSMNRNEIVKLYGTGEDDLANEWFIGYPINVFYDYEFGGIWQLDEAAEAAEYGWKPGVIRPVDQNGDGDIGAEDRVILGTPIPNWIGGITNTLRYNNFDFSFVINTTQGDMMYNDARADAVPGYGRYNNLDVDYWTPSNSSNVWPRPSTEFEGAPYSGLLGYIDGSFVRVRRVTLGYTLPSQVSQWFGAGSSRFYVTVQNPYVLTSDKLVGFSPQPSDSPSYRTFLFGVDLDF